MVIQLAKKIKDLENKKDGNLLIDILKVLGGSGSSIALRAAGLSIGEITGIATLATVIVGAPILAQHLRDQGEIQEGTHEAHEDQRRRARAQIFRPRRPGDPPIAEGPTIPLYVRPSHSLLPNQSLPTRPNETHAPPVPVITPPVRSPTPPQHVGSVDTRPNNSRFNRSQPLHTPTAFHGMHTRSEDQVWI